MTDEISTPEQIEEATNQGWRDDPEHPKYKTAAKFLEDGKKIAPIAAQNNKKLASEVEELKNIIHGYGADLIKERHAGEVAGYQKKVAELEGRKEQAFEDDDVDELKKIARLEKKLTPPEPLAVAAKPEPGPSPEFKEWAPKNPWYTSREPMHQAMQVFADSQIEDVKAMVNNDDELFAEITKRVKTNFPAQFAADGNSDHVAAVETNGRKPVKRNNGKKDWNSLPKETRDEVKDNGYVERYFAGDKEKYAKSYYEQFPE